MLTSMLIRAVLIAAIPFALAQADFQYQSNSRMTGGSLMQIMRFVPGGGAMKEAQVSTVAVKGDRMVRRSKRQAEIIDLGKRTITTVDFEKRTYSEMTFDQMKQMLEDASSRMSQQKASGKADGSVNLNLDADIKDTGLAKSVNGVDAHQMIITMSMTATDPQTSQAGTMKVTSEMWLARDISGADEMRDFYKKMATELDWVPTGLGGMMNRPDIARAMSKMMAAGGKMEGTPVQQTVRVGAVGVGGAADSGVPPSAPSGGGSSAGAQPAPQPSARDVVSAVLGGKSGGLAGFGRKKKQAAGDDTPAGSDANAPAQTSTSTALIEMTIDNTGFSNGNVDDSLFSVPVGFRKVEETESARRGR